MFISDWKTMIRIVSIAILFYFMLIVILRTSGKGTLSDLNAFDFLASVAIGSIAATTVLAVDTKFFDGLIAVIVWVSLQYIVSKLETKYVFISKLFMADPTLLYYNGEYLIENMKKTRVNKDYVLQQVRLKSGTVIENISAVLLEANGEVSVIEQLDDDIIQKLEKYK